MKKYLKWEETNFTWDNLFMLWEEVVLIDNFVKRGGGSVGYWEMIKNNPWEKNNKLLNENNINNFLKLYCRVNNIKYEKVKKRNNVKITVNGLHKVLNKNIANKSILVRKN